jgi:hypothetical protein
LLAARGALVGCNDLKKTCFDTVEEI